MKSNLVNASTRHKNPPWSACGRDWPKASNTRIFPRVRAIAGRQRVDWDGFYKFLDTQSHNPILSRFLIHHGIWTRQEKDDIAILRFPVVDFTSFFCRRNSTKRHRLCQCRQRHRSLWSPHVHGPAELHPRPGASYQCRPAYQTDFGNLNEGGKCSNWFYRSTSIQSMDVLPLPKSTGSAFVLS